MLVISKDKRHTLCFPMEELCSSLELFGKLRFCVFMRMSIKHCSGISWACIIWLCLSMFRVELASAPYQWGCFEELPLACLFTPILLCGPTKAIQMALFSGTGGLQLGYTHPQFHFICESKIHKTPLGCNNVAWSESPKNPSIILRFFWKMDFVF